MVRNASVMQDEVADLAIELIAATSLLPQTYDSLDQVWKLHRASLDMEGTSDTVEVLETIGPVSECEKGAVL